MDNFHKIGEGAVVNQLLAAIMRQPELWDQNNLRTTHPGTAHGQVNDIWLFFNEQGGDVVNDKMVVPYPAWDKLPQARPLIFDLMHFVQGVQLGRVIITKLGPGKKIAPHVDGGAPAEYYTRYQIALQSLPGSLFRIDDETVQFNSGDIWMIDNRKEHEVINNSDDDRVVMIVDIRS